MLSWEKLLNPVRLKELHGIKGAMETDKWRTELEKDYDRILFATPTRRLADKTQVFPMEENDSIRNRLTHSLEVSNLARSIGVRLAFKHAKKVFGSKHSKLKVKRNVPSLLAAIGLAHDLGNPPFGHQGEKAIQQWFKEGGCGDKSIDLDFLEFDGNAQTFRLLTKLQVLNDNFGLNLTVATLSALLKYPVVYGSKSKGGYEKYGIFQSEKKVVEEVWDHTGLSEGVRHPFTYIMEACDDIAYSIVDAEDTVKKGYASFYDLMDHLDSHKDGDKITNKVVKSSKEKNKEFRKEMLSPGELNDISMQMFRVNAIRVMIDSVIPVFIDRIESILYGTISPRFELIKNSSCFGLCDSVKKFDKKFGFENRDVLRLEIKGNKYIKSMMTMFWRAVSVGSDINLPFERYIFGEISENYRRIYNSDGNNYEKYQLICDALSGMTENYLINRMDEYKALESAIK